MRLAPSPQGKGSERHWRNWSASRVRTTRPSHRPQPLCASSPAENRELRDQVTALATLVDHYFAAWQETRTLLERRERELTELRRNIKPKLVSSRN